jgi:hypothetical protein
MGCARWSNTTPPCPDSSSYSLPSRPRRPTRNIRHTTSSSPVTNVTRHFVEQLTIAQDAGQISVEADLTRAAQLLIAVLDGLQVQWLLDDRVDMVAAFDQFLDGFRQILGAAGTPKPPARRAYGDRRTGHGGRGADGVRRAQDSNPR